MNANFLLLLLTGFFIIIGVFCLVFGIDNRTSKKTRKVLLEADLVFLIVIGLLIYFLMKKPLG